MQILSEDVPTFRQQWPGWLIDEFTFGEMMDAGYPGYLLMWGAYHGFRFGPVA